MPSAASNQASDKASVNQGGAAGSIFEGGGGDDDDDTTANGNRAGTGKSKHSTMRT